MPKLTIDGIEVEIANGMTVLQACEEAGIEIPRFCYHERLSIAGNCRMCLVEIEKMPKLAASCAMPAGDGMVVQTRSERVVKARKAVMEFQLINHPLDCPICDQGGECDLQDEAMAYGGDTSRFTEDKHSFEPKYMGTLIKTMMNRCIHCTRCVRFIAEIAGTEEIGATGRGGDTEIMTYLKSAVTSELSGNVIDLCPVGALTSVPYANQARPWELTKTESIDVMDAVGSNIRIDSRGAAVMRIMPRNNDDVNEEWLADKSRFVWDGLKSRRLDRPYVRINDKLQEASWDEAFAAIKTKMDELEPENMTAIAGDLSAAEEMFALKELLKLSGKTENRASYLFNTTIAGIEDADALLLIGTNPRLEAAVLNARIRKRWLAGNFPIGLIGENAELTYDYKYLGAGPESLSELASGKDSFSKTLKKAECPMLIIGQGALNRKDADAVMALAINLAQDSGMITGDWNGFNVLHTAASKVASLDLGFPDARDAGLVWLLGADETDMDQLGDAFIIYQGSHGDAGAHRADVILPGSAYTEKSGTYLNTEGRAQQTARAVFPPGEAKEDWKIIRAMSGVLGEALPFDTLQELRAKMYEAAPHFAKIGEIEPAGALKAPKAGKVSGDPFANAVTDHYLTNPILRASATMVQCAAPEAEEAEEATGTDD